MIRRRRESVTVEELVRYMEQVRAHHILPEDIKQLTDEIVLVNAFLDHFVGGMSPADVKLQGPIDA